MNKIHLLVKNLLASILTVSILISISAGLQSCSSKSAKSVDSGNQETAQASVAKAADEISVMQFNVENLFDTIHDEGTEDYTNLPLSVKKKPEVQKFCAEMKNSFYKEECYNKDWNDDILKFKLSQLGKVIRHVDHGQGPDVLFLEEVENLNVLKMLVDSQLKDLGYQTISLLEGPDLRGIDPGFISKFPIVGKPSIHLIPYTDANPEKLKYAKRSRGILEVTVKLPNKKDVTFLVAHFPSQSNPTEWRKQAVEFATQKMKDYASQGRAVILGGDLNITTEEEKESGYFSKIFSTAGQVSHLVGCKHCEGSHNYKGEWSFLDVIVYGNEIGKAGLTLIPESITVLKVAHHMKRNGGPLRFNEEKKEGVTDHYPLYSRLKIK